MLPVRLMFAKPVRGTCDKPIGLYKDRFAFVCCYFVFIEDLVVFGLKKVRVQRGILFYFLYFVSVV